MKTLWEINTCSFTWDTSNLIRIGQKKRRHRFVKLAKRLIFKRFVLPFRRMHFWATQGLLTFAPLAQRAKVNPSSLLWIIFNLKTYQETIFKRYISLLFQIICNLETYWETLFKGKPLFSFKSPKKRKRNLPVDNLLKL